MSTKAEIPEFGAPKPILFSWTFQERQDNPEDIDFGKVKREYRVIGKDYDEAVDKLRLLGLDGVMKSKVYVVVEIQDRQMIDPKLLGSFVKALEKSIEIDNIKESLLVKGKAVIKDSA